jgi:hypothetical protein
VYPCPEGKGDSGTSNDLPPIFIFNVLLDTYRNKCVLIVIAMVTEVLNFGIY